MKGQKKVVGMKVIGLGMLWISGAVHATEVPQWWSARGVANTQQMDQDYAPVNQGQVKWMAVQAAEEFNAKLRDGAGSVIRTLTNSFQNTDNHAAVNEGQLKNVAKPFYDRLRSFGLTNTYPAGVGTNNYPWEASTNEASDYSVANIGQLKHLFSFDFDSMSVRWTTNPPTERVFTHYWHPDSSNTHGCAWWNYTDVTHIPNYPNVDWLYPRKDVGQSFYVASNLVMDSFSLQSTEDFFGGTKSFTVNIFKSPDINAIGTSVSTQHVVWPGPTLTESSPDGIWVTFDVENLSLEGQNYYTFMLSWDTVENKAQVFKDDRRGSYFGGGLV